MCSKQLCIRMNQSKVQGCENREQAATALRKGTVVTSLEQCTYGAKGHPARGDARQASRCQDHNCCCWEASLRRAMRASAAAAICSLLLLASCSDLDSAAGLLALPCLLLQQSCFSSYRHKPVATRASFMYTLVYGKHGHRT